VAMFIAALPMDFEQRRLIEKRQVPVIARGIVRPEHRTICDFCRFYFAVLFPNNKCLPEGRCLGVELQYFKNTALKLIGRAGNIA